MKIYIAGKITGDKGYREKFAAVEAALWAQGFTVINPAGVKPGVPDMFLPVAREGCHGLYIELKRRDGGRVSTEQTAWMDALARQGYKTALCHGWDAAREEMLRTLREIC